jgi:glycosyltransferase involved in cell wall biosynthesis
MKLTFLIADRNDYRGGPIVNMRRLLPRLVEHGHSVRILGLAGDESPTLDWLADEVGIPVQKAPKQLQFTEQKVKWILNRLESNRPDVFVPNCFVVGFFAARWAREAGIPSMGYFRSDDEYYWGMAEQFIYRPDPWALSGVACVSRRLMNRLREQMDEQSNVKFCFLPSGVPVPNLVADQNRLGFKICYIGRFEEEQKKFRDTARAMLRNLANGVCTHVGFFGSGSLQAWLEEEIAARNIDDRVTVHGAVDPEELHSALTEYHASILLSDYEGTPGAVMDAMAVGLVPVTVRLSDGTSELVTDGFTGLQCDDRDDSFDQCLKRLADDLSLRQQLAKNARMRIIEEYSIDRTVNDFESFARKLISCRGVQSKMQIPFHLSLPPVRQGLHREDFRVPEFPVRFCNTIKQLGGVMRQAVRRTWRRTVLRAFRWAARRLAV